MPCCYQPVGNHSTLSSWLSGAACCGSALYQISASKPCSPKRQRRCFQGCWWAGYLQRILSAHVWCATCVIPLYHTVPSASSQELQVNRVAAFLWLGRWLNNFSLKKLCAITTMTQRHPLKEKTWLVSADCRDPTPHMLRGTTGTTYLWKLCWATETSPLTTQNLK